MAGLPLEVRSAGELVRERGGGCRWEGHDPCTPYSSVCVLVREGRVVGGEGGEGLWAVREGRGC